MRIPSLLSRTSFGASSVSRRWNIPKRYYSSGGSAATGVCFDIDGVLLRGSHVLPGAYEALDKLDAYQIPYIFLTNGGGVSEAKKAQQLSEVLGKEISDRQVIVSHTPLRALVPELKNRKVLVIGYKQSLQVAREEYGFRKAFSPAEVIGHSPQIYPFREYPYFQMSQEDYEAPWHGIMVFHDSIDWGADCQVSADILRGLLPLPAEQNSNAIQTARIEASNVQSIKPPDLATSQYVPVYATNPDFVFAGEYELPRLAQGAFIQTLDSVYNRLTGEKLGVKWLGKPTSATFQFAQYQLEHWSQHMSLAHQEDKELSATNDSCNLKRIYMIGDNPEADIRGANGAGEPWRGILVRSGVFSGKLAPEDQPEITMDGVMNAVNYVINQQKEK
eukprot:gb/GECG01002170.1/.p1 GENE.gb/GECG01002170.1/~~gb/GECG01002170.1/.p1  ORF type:complete len:389 (+),score=43.01 gb/GECG01002170.1/:1-1167(+)